jgi:hypothetical protein
MQKNVVFKTKTIRFLINLWHLIKSKWHELILVIIRIILYQFWFKKLV